MKILLILLMLVLVIMASPIVNYVRAKKADLRISFGEVTKLTFMKLVTKSFLKELAEYQQNKVPVSLNDLVGLKLAGGNPENCLKGFIYAQEKGLKTDFKTIMAIDLSGEDVMKTFENSAKTYSFQLLDIENEKLSVDLKVQYKYNFPTLFIDKNEEIIKDKISEIIADFLNTHENNDIAKVHRAIQNDLLSNKFWKEKASINIIKQDISVKGKPINTT